MIDYASKDSREAFERAFQAADSRQKLLQLRLGLEEELVQRQGELQVARATKYRTGHYLAASDYDRLAQAPKLLGLRIQRIQIKLGTFNDARRTAAVETEKDYLRRFHDHAKTLLTEDTFAQIHDAALGRG